jgi:hypothetical protein
MGGANAKGANEQTLPGVHRQAACPRHFVNLETTMPMTGVDPLQEFLSSLAGERKPIPLVATRIDVLIKGGLAIVTTERTFRSARGGARDL